MFTCDVCGKEFLKKYNFKVHSLTHSKTKTVKCCMPSCGKLFSTVSSRNSHLLSHPEYAKHVNKKIKCPSCPKTFSKQSELISHLAVHSSARDFQCLDCGKTFKRRSNLLFHVQIHSGEEKAFKCKKCSKSFRKRYELIIHDRTHTGEKNFYCENCDARFITNSVLRKHVLKHHTPNRPTFDCALCSKSYKLQKSLVDHMHKHNNDFQETCPVIGCYKVFKTERALTSHQSLHHSKSNEKTTCSVCSKNCLTKSKLEEHMRHHTGQKPFVCLEEDCNKTFSTKTGLQRHLFLHTGVKPYVCLKCSKEFAFASHYNSHVRSHYTIEKYKCKLCLDHVNTKMSTAKIHILQVHLGIKWEPKIFKRANVKINEKINGAIEKILVNTNEDIEEMASLLIEKGNTEVLHKVKPPNIPALDAEDKFNSIEQTIPAMDEMLEIDVDQKPDIQDGLNPNQQLHSFHFPDVIDPMDIKTEPEDEYTKQKILDSYQTISDTLDPESTISSFLQDPNLLQSLPNITDGQQICIYDPTTKEQVVLTSSVCLDNGLENVELQSVHCDEEETIEEGNFDSSDQYITRDHFNHEESSHQDPETITNSLQSNVTTIFGKDEADESDEEETGTPGVSDEYSGEVLVADNELVDISQQAESASVPVPSIKMGDNIQKFHIEHPTRGTIKFARLSSDVKGKVEKVTETIVFLGEDTTIINKNFSNCDVTKICIRNELEFLKVMNSMKITNEQLHNVTHKYECSNCDNFFWDTTALKKHMETHSDKTTEIHSETDSVNHSAGQLNEESVMKTCVQCNKHFQSNSELEPFYCSDCKAGCNEVYQCSLCSKILKSKRHASAHMREHERAQEEYICNFPDCNKKFTRKRNLNFHQRLHADIRPYQCDQCDKCFVAQFQLNAHMKKHWGGQSYVCNEPGCGAALTTRTGFLRHMIIHSGEKKYKCHVCNHPFAFVGHLNTHMLIHTGEKKYLCPNCGKRFTRSTVLRRHLDKKVCHSIASSDTKRVL